MTPFLQDADCTLLLGDVLDVLRDMPAESVDCVVTSPPYWGLRDYGTGIWEGGDEGCDHVARFSTSALADSPASTRGGANKIPEARDHYRDVCGKCGARRVDNQLGLEPTPDQYVQRMVAVFREVRRVLCPHGTCWVNLGDSYNANVGAGFNANARIGQQDTRRASGLAAKQLVGIPWRVAFALQADGWWLRSDIVWAKPNPMPESVTDRPTKAHEYVFLLAKQARYYFDQEAVREPITSEASIKRARSTPVQIHPPQYRQDKGETRGYRLRPLEGEGGHRNVRSVWTIATQPYPEAHFATYPEELVRRCVLAGCPERVCRVCGKASERIVEVESSWRSRSEGGAIRGNLAPEGLVGAGTQRAVHGAGVSHDLDSRRRAVLGWSECKCLACPVHGPPPDGLEACDRCARSLWPSWRPGLVLDPFVGSGTTCLVARNHGRHSVGIDLNADYLALAATRLQQLSLLTAEARPETTSSATTQEGNPEQSAM